MEKAFIDTDVLVKLLKGSKYITRSINLLRDEGFKIYTFRKCIYELYSIIKGTNKKPGKNPFRDLVSKDINDIAQKLFKGNEAIDTLLNAYYWYNLCEEWRGWDYFETIKDSIEKYVIEPDRAKALEWLEIQKEFVSWKEKVSSAFSLINKLVDDKEIHICEYAHVYSSEWYQQEGFALEQEFAKNSLLPNEDFELIISAMYLRVKVFITDDKEFTRRGRLSLGLNSPAPVFCHIDRLEDALQDGFQKAIYI